MEALGKHPSGDETFKRLELSLVSLTCNLETTSQAEEKSQPEESDSFFLLQLPASLRGYLPLKKTIRCFH